jgi:hypothetical protein
LSEYSSPGRSTDYACTSVETPIPVGASANLVPVAPEQELTGVHPHRSVAAESSRSEEVADLLAANEDAPHDLIGGVGLEELKDAVEDLVVDIVG